MSQPSAKAIEVIMTCIGSLLSTGRGPDLQS
jgi:hypothetical protein